MESVYKEAFVDELEKISNGDMMQYFHDNPDKLKEYLARKEAKKARKERKEWGDYSERTTDDS